VVKRTMKVINSKMDDIMKKKGCDASNMYDEEVLETEQDFSDDEMERETKRLRKNLKRNQRG
jgi:hypothetical protein